MFVEEMIRRAAQSGELTDDVLIGAYTTSHGLPFGHAPDTDKTRSLALRQAKAKLENRNVREALRGLYELAGFDLVEGLEWHLKHIRGEITEEKTVVVRDTKDSAHVEVVEVKKPPNYSALRDLMKTITPQPALRVEGRVLHGHVALPNATPQIAARSISDITIEQEADDDED